MKFLSAIAFLWLAVAECLAGDAAFTNFLDFQGRPQQVRMAFAYFLDAPVTNVTKDRVIFRTDTAGGFTITNYYAGNYRVEFQGTDRITTNWFEFPSTNGTINAFDSVWRRGPTNGITQALTVAAGNAAFMPLPTNNTTATTGQVAIKTGSNTKWIPNDVVIKVFTNAVVAPWGSIDISASTTAGIQEALDAMPRVTDVVSGVGGGEIDFAPGTFLLFTNVFIPNYFPFCLKMKGAGFNGTIIEGRGFDSATNRAMFSCITNHVQGLSLTNALTLFVSDCGFIHTNETQTNFLWDVEGQTFSKFEDCMFTTMGALLTGQSGYSLNYEANYPNRAIGLVGLSVSKKGDNANSQCYVKHCLFYALANGIIANPVIARIEDSYFAMCGKFNTTPPPANSPSTLFAHTNLWRGLAAAANSDYRGWLSTGAAIVFGENGTPNYWVTKNVFFDCGAMAAMGLDTLGTSEGHTIVFRDNYQVDQGSSFATSGFRLLTGDATSSVVSDFFEGASTAFPLNDSLCTNGPVGRPSLQPNAAEPTIPIPTFRMAHSGIANDADSYFVLTSGGSTAPRTIANGLGITNIPNAGLQNSAITINGTSVSLGGTVTVGGTIPFDVTQFAPATAGTNIRSGAIVTNLTIRGNVGRTNALYVDQNSLIWSNVAISLTISNNPTGVICFAASGDTADFLTYQPQGLISAGVGNLFSGSPLGSHSMFGGGTLNIMHGTSRSFNFIAAGSLNVLDETTYGFIGAGLNNAISNGFASSIAGGLNNIVTANYGTVAGGRSNVVSGITGLAAGYRASSLHNGAFVWGDSSDSVKQSSAADTFNVFASGGAFFNSTLSATNGVLRQIVTKTGDYGAGPSDEVILINGTTKTITLPTAASIGGKVYTVKLIASGTTGTIATTSSQNIDGATTYSLSAQYKYATVISNGTQWYIIANN